MIKLIVLINRNSPECNILNIAKSHHIMIVATFLPTEINFGPISTNGNSICLSDTLYQQGPSAKGTDGIMSKNPSQQDFWFWSTYVQYFRGVCGRKYPQQVLVGLVRTTTIRICILESSTCRSRSKSLVFGTWRVWGCVLSLLFE